MALAPPLDVFFVGGAVVPVLHGFGHGRLPAAVAGVELVGITVESEGDAEWRIGVPYGFNIGLLAAYGAGFSLGHQRSCVIGDRRRCLIGGYVALLRQRLVVSIKVDDDIAVLESFDGSHDLPSFCHCAAGAFCRACLRCCSYRFPPAPHWYMRLFSEGRCNLSLKFLVHIPPGFCA